MRDWIARREERGIYHQLVKKTRSRRSCCMTRPMTTSTMFVYVLHARARAQLAGKIHYPITGVISRLVARQVAAVVVIRATNTKFVVKSRSQVYFAQHVVATCNIETRNTIFAVTHEARIMRVLATTVLYSLVLKHRKSVRF